MGCSNPEAIAAMSEAFASSLTTPVSLNWCSKLSPIELLRRQIRASVTRLACEKPRFSD